MGTPQRQPPLPRGVLLKVAASGIGSGLVRPTLRALFVNENIGGNATMHLHMRRALESHQADISPTFLDVPPRGPLRRLLGAAVPGLSRLDIDLAPVRSQLALSAHVRRRLRPLADEADVLHVYTHNAGLLSTPLLRRMPSVVALDATTLQSTRLLPYRSPTRFTDASVQPAKMLERRVYDAADLIVAKSSWARRSLIEDYGVDERRIRVIPYGIEIPSVPLVERREDQIAFVGRSMARKGGWLLIDAWRRSLRKDARLVVVTPEPVAPEPGLIVVNDLRAGDFRLFELLAASTVLAFPSTADTFGYAAIEAMAVETPVVAFDCGAIPEIVLQGRTGLLVEPGDGEALSAALGVLLADPLRARVLGAAARQRALATFDANATTAAVVALLHEVAGSARPSGPRPGRAPERGA